MVNVYKGFQQRFQQASLSQRLIMGLVLALVAIILFSSVPAYIAMWQQLERQVWERVEHGQDATQALYRAEITRMKKLVGLFANRPTLNQLVLAGDTAGLEPYLDELQWEGGNLDMAQVVTPDFLVGDPLPGLPPPAEFLAGNEPYFADLISLGDPPSLYIVSVSQVQPAARDAEPLGWVVLAQQLHSAAMLTLQEETGLAQSLIVGEQRVATSLPGTPDWSMNIDAAIQAETNGQHYYIKGRIGSELYYVGLIPLFSSHGNVVALSEVALAGSAIRREMISTFTFSGGISLLVMLACALVIVRLARTITDPLNQLSQAAERISQGNLENPTPVDTSLPEIDHLAQHFDQARRQMRQTLALTQREIKQAVRLLSSVREGVVELDHAEHITFINTDAEEILGCRAENVLHRHFSHIFPPAPGEAVGLQALLSEAKTDSAPHRITTLDAQGSPLLLAVRVSCLANNQSEADDACCILVFREVTEEEAVERLRYNFLANVAHEFRTPLAGICATTELMVEESSTLTSTELVQLVETIHLSTLHLQTLVDNLLESTTIEAGIFKVHCYPINIEEVVQRASSLMAPLFNRRAQVLETSLPPELPTLWADPNRLAQVLVNLLSNASKFSPMDSKIELVISQDSEWLTVSVLDSGPGLPAGRFADMFNRYVSTNQLHDTQYGIGLGLSVVKTIIEVHGGQVGAENRPQGGAVVWFTIPIQPPKELENA
jgi:two-component system phosphate regulon sensor histidine kinase PhoR